jgi:hypothetical protein
VGGGIPDTNWRIKNQFSDLRRNSTRIIKKTQSQAKKDIFRAALKPFQTYSAKRFAFQPEAGPRTLGWPTSKNLRVIADEDRPHFLIFKNSLLAMIMQPGNTFLTILLDTGGRRSSSKRGCLFPSNARVGHCIHLTPVGPLKYLVPYR